MSTYDELSQKLRNIVFILIAIALVFKIMIYPKFYDPTSYKGGSFSFVVPEGWEKYKLPEMEKSEDPKTRMEAVVLAPSDQAQRIRANKDKVFKDIGVGEMPDTLIRFMAVQLEQPIWLDVHFEDILEQIWKSGLIVKDKGEMKMQDEIVKWVLSETPGPNMRIILEFYIAPPQRSGRLLKIEYLTTPASFGKYRQGFEEARQSFKF